MKVLIDSDSVAFASAASSDDQGKKSFATLQEAKDFAYQYKNNLKPGERIVS
jgi:hypothetical protein